MRVSPHSITLWENAGKLYSPYSMCYKEAVVFTHGTQKDQLGESGTFDKS